MKNPVLFAAIRKDQDENLRLISFLEKRSKADITREAIDLYLNHSPKVEKYRDQFTKREED